MLLIIFGIFPYHQGNYVFISLGQQW